LVSIGTEGSSTDADGDEDLAKELLLHRLHPIGLTTGPS
jgi:hypothetical protein